MNNFENFNYPTKEKEVVSSEQIKKLVALTKKSLEMMENTNNVERFCELFGMVAKNVIILKQNGSFNEVTLTKLKGAPINNATSLLNGLSRLTEKYVPVE